MRRIYRFNKTIYHVLAGFRMAFWILVGREDKSRKIISEHMDW